MHVSFALVQELQQSALMNVTSMYLSIRPSLNNFIDFPFIVILPAFTFKLHFWILFAASIQIQKAFSIKF